MAAVVVVTGGPLQAFGDASAECSTPTRWIAAAIVFELLSFGGYVALLRLVAGRAAPRLGLRASAQVTLGARRPRACCPPQASVAWH